MKKNLQLIFGIVWVVLGAVLIGLAFAGKTDGFWNGVGSALLVIGILRLLRAYRLGRNPDYREKMEIEVSDERNRYIRGKAWAWAGYLFIVIAGVSVIAFKIMGQELLMMAAFYAVCLLLVLFWVSYLVLKKKY